MVSPIIPATPAFDMNGTPFSPDFGDVYHCGDSWPGQARHVFLGGLGGSTIVLPLCPSSPLWFSC